MHSLFIIEWESLVGRMSKLLSRVSPECLQSYSGNHALEPRVIARVSTECLQRVYGVNQLEVGQDS